jgi:hypothetical protein
MATVGNLVHSALGTVVGGLWQTLMEAWGAVCRWVVQVGQYCADLVKAAISACGFSPDLSWRAAQNVLNIIETWFPFKFLCLAVFTYVGIAVIVGRVRWTLRMLGRPV